MKQQLVTGVIAQYKRDIGDKERTPHDEEKEEDDSQNLREGRRKQKLNE